MKMWRTVTLLAVLYGCETWCLVLTDESRPSVSENTVLEEICGGKREEWRKRHDEYQKAWHADHKRKIRNIYRSLLKGRTY
jgi:hypothetical protein